LEDEGHAEIAEEEEIREQTPDLKQWHRISSIGNRAHANESNEEAELAVP
jgi:hypothetical protein